MPQPNILLIQADQLAAQALPSYGHPLVQAPNITALGKQGVVFESNYCNFPLCSPSRFSMLTGQLPSRIGAFDNACDLSAQIPTFAHYLRAMGYRTILAGKMHFVGADQLHGFEERLTTDIYPSDFTWTPDWDHPERVLEWYHNMIDVVQAGVATATIDLDYGEEVGFHAARRLYGLAREADQRPFCMVVSFTHPHDPYVMPPRYWELYDPATIDLPRVPMIPYDQCDPHSQRLYKNYGIDEYEISEEQIRKARHGYYAAISYVDDKVGQLMQALRETGQAENTVVIFTSDHGDMLGERGLWYKQCFYEGSARVPLIVHAPGRFAPRRIASHTSLVDLLPTFVDLAQRDSAAGKPMEWADPIDGHSLLPLLQGDLSQASDEVFAENLGEYQAAPALMIRRGRYKYIHCPGDPDLLYDLVADPDELHNLADQLDVADLVADFRVEVAQRWDVTGLTEQILKSQRQRRLVGRALNRGRRTHWDYQPPSDASQQYVRSHMELWELMRRTRYPSVEMPQAVRPVQRHVTSYAES